MSPANLAHHRRACTEREIYQRLFLKRAVTARQVKELRIRLRLAYGVTLQEYASLFDQQGGVCAICKGKPDIWNTLAVDHCHVTGRIRGLLCNKCNSILGLAKDQPGLLVKACRYLQTGLEGADPDTG